MNMLISVPGLEMQGIEFLEQSRKKPVYAGFFIDDLQNIDIPAPPEKLIS